MEKALNHWSGRQPHPALLGGMLAVLRSAALVGVEAVPVEVEVNTGEQGELRIEIVGLPDTAVKESEDRVLSAMMNTGLRTHETKTTVNLAPGDLRKEGAMYDLPIAVGMAAATGQISKERLAHYLIAGELGLSGGTRAVKGGVAIAMLAKRLGLKGVLLPRPSAEEAALVDGIEAVAADSLDGALRFLSGDARYVPLPPAANPPPPAAITCSSSAHRARGNRSSPNGFRRFCRRPTPKNSWKSSPCTRPQA